MTPTIVLRGPVPNHVYRPLRLARRYKPSLYNNNNNNMIINWLEFDESWCKNGSFTFVRPAVCFQGCVSPCCDLHVVAMRSEGLGRRNFGATAGKSCDTNPPAWRRHINTNTWNSSTHWHFYIYCFMFIERSGVMLKPMWIHPPGGAVLLPAVSSPQVAVCRVQDGLVSFHLHHTLRLQIFFCVNEPEFGLILY